MRLDPINGTVEPEQTICTAARGDYLDGYVGDMTFEEIMEPIDGRSIEEKKRNLIWQLLDRGHFGPFEHVSMTIAFEDMSRSCMAQITRHRQVTFDIQSMRYVDFSGKAAEQVVVPKSFKDEDHFSREDGVLEVEPETQEEFEQRYLDLAQQQFEFYQDAVAAGFPKEDVRFALPIGTAVNGTMTMNARTMLHILNMRGKADAQWEARQLSNMIEDIGLHWCPNTFEWWQEKGPMKLSP